MPNEISEEDITGWKESAKWRTRAWNLVRIYSTDGAGEFCVHGALYFQNAWWPTNWNINGINIQRKDQDLVLQND